MFRTARWRLVTWNVSVLVLILVLLGVAVYSVFSSQIYSGVDQQLDNQREHIEQYLIANDWNPLGLYYFNVNTPYEPGIRTVFTNAQGQVVVSTDCLVPLGQIPQCPPYGTQPTSKEGVREALAHGRDLRTVTALGQPQRVLTYTETDPQGRFVALFQSSRLAAGEEGSLQELRRLLIFGGLLGILLSGFGSFFLANRALVPIRQAFARQRQFTADASHELRTPLSLIRANAEMLARHGDRMPEGDAELVAEIIGETDHLNRLVSDLLTLARADSDQTQITTKPVDLRALVSEVHEDVQRIAEARGIESNAVLNGPVTVEGDEVRLRQLLLILLDNALKYTDPGGHVDVSLARDNGRATLRVADTGIGIPDKDLPHIFERFYRVDRAREHESGGTGLGLAIAKWIVQVHHGTVKVESEIGNGTEVQVDLPARADKGG